MNGTCNLGTIFIFKIIQSQNLTFQKIKKWI